MTEPEPHPLLRQISYLRDCCLDQKQVDIVEMEAKDLIEQLEATRKERSDAVEVAARAMERSQNLEEQLEALRAQLEHADSMCARSFGACFDRSVLSPASDPEAPEAFAGTLMDGLDTERTS